MAAALQHANLVKEKEIVTKEFNPINHNIDKVKENTNMLNSSIPNSNPSSNLNNPTSTSNSSSSTQISSSSDSSSTADLNIRPHITINVIISEGILSKDISDKIRDSSNCITANIKVFTDHTLQSILDGMITRLNLNALRSRLYFIHGEVSAQPTVDNNNSTTSAKNRRKKSAPPPKGLTQPQHIELDLHQSVAQLGLVEGQKITLCLRAAENYPIIVL